MIGSDRFSWLRPSSPQHARNKILYATFLIELAHRLRQLLPVPILNKAQPSKNATVLLRRSTWQAVASQVWNYNVSIGTVLPSADTISCGMPFALG